MKTLTKVSTLVLALTFLLVYSLKAQNQKIINPGKNLNSGKMKTYLIEREIPDAGKFDHGKLKSISEKSCSVLKEMGPNIQWIQSYVTGNKIYCIYKATSPELIKQHAAKGGFPANSIVEIANVISPATATAK